MAEHHLPNGYICQKCGEEFSRANATFHAFCKERVFDADKFRENGFAVITLRQYNDIIR